MSLFEFDLRLHLEKLAESFELFQFIAKLLAELDTISLFDAFCHYACEQKINRHALYDCTKCFKQKE